MAGDGATGAGEKVPEWPEDTWQERKDSEWTRGWGSLVAPTVGWTGASCGVSMAKLHPHPSTGMRPAWSLPVATRPSISTPK